MREAEQTDGKSHHQVQERPTEDEEQTKMSAAQENRKQASGRRSKRIGTQHDSSYVILF